ncbi:hypothetical protein Pelo_11084 [Pelomyxa schiedti]|nr:hypothetical protein Pelo_11084 [Pelomyxa schiedti]
MVGNTHALVTPASTTTTPTTSAASKPTAAPTPTPSSSSVSASTSASSTATATAATPLATSPEQNSHKWVVYVRAPPEAGTADISAAIHQVEFGLHPTFNPRVVRVDQPPYQLERVGWGTFDVSVTIRFRVATGIEHPATYIHTLSFSSPDTHKTYPLS